MPSQAVTERQQYIAGEQCKSRARQEEGGQLAGALSQASEKTSKVGITLYSIPGLTGSPATEAASARPSPRRR